MSSTLHISACIQLDGEHFIAAWNERTACQACEHQTVVVYGSETRNRWWRQLVFDSSRLPTRPVSVCMTLEDSGWLSC